MMRGSVIALSNGSGASLATYAYSPYGQSAGSSFSRFGFTGQTVIEGTEVMHFKARAYSPELGRFLQPDPIGFSGGDTNLYAYAANDPVNFTDPSGLFFKKLFKGVKKLAKKVVKGAKKAAKAAVKAGKFAPLLGSETGLGGRVLRFAAAQALDFAVGGGSRGGDGDGSQDVRRRTCPALISGPDGISCGLGPNSVRFLSGNGRARLASAAAFLARAPAQGFSENVALSTAILPSGNTPISEFDARGVVGLNRGGAIGLDSARNAGALALAVRLSIFTDNSPVSRGAPDNIRKALNASFVNSGLPVFLLAPRGRPGSALVIEFTGNVGGIATGTVSEISF